MMRGFLDRMMRPRDLVLTYHRVSNPENQLGPLRGVRGVLTTEAALTTSDFEHIRSLNVDALGLADGEVIKIKR